MGAETFLVTGGCRGLGRGIVDALLQTNARVAFTYRTGGEIAAEIESASDGRARGFPLDLEEIERPDALVDEVQQACGSIAGLVNCAGIRRESLLAMTSDADWSAVIETNLGGLFRCCRAVLPRMVRARRGSIVNIASLSALHGLAGQSAYAASKAGVLGLTRSLAREVGKRGIRVNAVVPGFVKTEMTAGLEPARIEALRANECLAAGVTIESVAESVLFLLSDRAASITGQALVVDAGSSA